MGQEHIEWFPGQGGGQPEEKGGVELSMLVRGDDYRSQGLC